MSSNTTAKVLQLKSLYQVARDNRIENQKAESSFPVELKVAHPVPLAARLECH